MKKIGVIFGGMSTEHDVSTVSGISVVRNLDKSKYEVYPIYIARSGEWYLYKDNGKEIRVGDQISATDKIENIFEFLKTIDIAFPVMHGLFGEDGTIQGMLEMLQIKYVGTRVLGSSVCMDKAYTKIIFDKAQIPQVNYIYLREYNGKYIFVDEHFEEAIMDIKEISRKGAETLGFPIFVKPSNSGSSVGITKVNNVNELEEAIKYAEKYDKKILLEEMIIGREIECAVLGNEEPQASVLGEILPADEFYSFDAKYMDSASKTVIKPNLPDNLIEKTRELAKKAYKALDCKGLSRVDFFVNEEENKVYINEINTMPGFTQISMYPKLWEATGVNYTELLDKLINLALEN